MENSRPPSLQEIEAGVVGHPVSEKGERGGSPLTVPAERQKIRPNSPVALSEVEGRLRW